MKSEIKIDFNNNEVLRSVIEESYFSSGQMGKLIKNVSTPIRVTPQLDDILYTVIRGLNNATIKIQNSDLIDGNMRFMVDESGDGSINLNPISIYCVPVQDGRYSFY
jgi:hypothetical protein